jgi:hypothetical protein
MRPRLQGDGSSIPQDQDRIYFNLQAVFLAYWSGSDLLNNCNPYANRNFGLNMTQLQIVLFFELNAYLINCIDNKQKSSAPDKNPGHCLNYKHIWQCQKQENFLKQQ